MYRSRTHFPEMPTLDEHFMHELIEFGRAGMTKSEILHLFSLEWDDLNETEKVHFMEQLRFGMATGIKQMSNALFAQARSKGGSQVAINYLRRFADEWEKPLESESGEGSGSSTGEGIFNFNFKGLG